MAYNKDRESRCSDEEEEADRRRKKVCVFCGKEQCN